MKKCLNRNTLKYIAIIAMLLDHIAMLLFTKNSNIALYSTFRFIGRLTAPIMCYFIAEGFYYTHSRKKYGERLALFAVISQFAYTFAHHKTILTSNLFTDLNVIYTLFIGFLVLVLSPGNGARLHQMESTGNFDYFAHIFHALGIYGLTLLECLPILIALIYQLYLCYSHKLFKKHQDFFVGFLYVFLVGFLALTIMVFSPNFPARSSAPFTIFVISANVALYLLLKQENVKVMPKTLMYSMYAVFGIYFLVTSSNCIYGLNTLNQDMAKRTELVQEKIAKGEKNLLVEPLTVETSRYIFVADVRVKKDFYANLIMSRYYHIDSIQRSCDYVKTFTHSDLIIIQDFGTPVCQATKQN